VSPRDTTDTERPPPPRDRAIDELAAALRRPREEVAALVDLLVLAAAHEAGARVSESLLEPLAIAVQQSSDGVRGVLRHAHRELGGGQ
jgi:hypothetical protein